MDCKERRLIIVLLAISFTMLIAGCYFVPFVIHVWTYLANLAGDKDVFLASLLAIYFVMFALLGAVFGLIINAYAPCCVKAACDLMRKKRS